MVAQQFQSQPGSLASEGRRPSEELERRVLDMADELGEARRACQAAESEADTLRGQVRERDEEIARLQDQAASGANGDEDPWREAVRERVEFLLRRIDEIEGSI